MKQRLATLIAAIPGSAGSGTENAVITGITADSRSVVPGMAFVAIPGTHDDGCRYISEAIDRGAGAIFSAQSGSPIGGCAWVRVPDARRAVSQLAAAWYRYPSRSLKVSGITGTNGKTSVSFILRHILRKLGASSGLIGTVRYELGERSIPATRTTPDAVELQRMLGEMRDVGCEHVVMEVSSHALEQHRVADVSFDLAAFTNLTRDHLDYHKDMEAYFAAKRRLFDLFGSETPMPAVVNWDDAYGRRLVRELTDDRDVIRVGLGEGEIPEFRASNILFGPDETHFEMGGAGQVLPVRVPLIGQPNVTNALTAVAMANQLGFDLRDIVESLQDLGTIPGRMESVQCGQPFRVFVDYAHTADALDRLLVTVREIGANRVLLLFGCGGGRDQGKRQEMGCVAARRADYCWVTNDNPRFESPERIVSQVVEGLSAERSSGWVIEHDRRCAIDQVIRSAQVGDVVVIAGKGHETYQEIDGTVAPFDDRYYAEKTLGALGYSPMAVRLAS